MKFQNKFRFLPVLILSLVAVSSSAASPDDLIGKSFAFIHQYTNNWGLHDDIKLDCFYNYTSSRPISKQVNGKNRYCAVGKLTTSDSIYHRIFRGVDFIHNPSKTSYFIMIDERGDSLFITIPKYNHSKNFVSYKKSFGHKCITNFREYGFFKYSCIDIPSFELSHWESQIDTITSTVDQPFIHDALFIPKYRVISYNIDDYGEPYTTVLRNEQDTLYNLSLSQISDIAHSISSLYKDIPVLSNYINNFDKSILDSLNNFSNQGIWINDNLLTHAVHSTSSHYQDGYETRLRNWSKPLKGRLSSAALGGPVYQFHSVQVSGIKLLRNLLTRIEKFEFKNEQRVGAISRKKFFIPSDSLKFRYYLTLIPRQDSIYDYSEWNHSHYCLKGCEINDTIFVPIDHNILSGILTDSQFRSIKDGFYENEQHLWNDFSDEQRAYYEIATRVWGEEIARIVCRGEVRLGFDEDMCHFAFQQTPYNTKMAQTPLGLAECQDFFMEGVKLYFQNKILTGIKWQGDKLFQPRNRY